MQKKLKKANNSSLNKSEQVLIQQYKGQIPHSSELAKYEQILPGSADRILKMAEKNQEIECRFRIEQQRIEKRDSLIGAMAIFIIIMALIIGGIVMLMNISSDGIVSIGQLLSGIGTLLAGIVAIYKMLIGKKE